MVNLLAPFVPFVKGGSTAWISGPCRQTTGKLLARTPRETGQMMITLMPRMAADDVSRVQTKPVIIGPVMRCRPISTLIKQRPKLRGLPLLLLLDFRLLVDRSDLDFLFRVRVGIQPQTRSFQGLHILSGVHELDKLWA